MPQEKCSLSATHIWFWSLIYTRNSTQFDLTQWPIHRLTPWASHPKRKTKEIFAGIYLSPFDQRLPVGEQEKDWRLLEGTLPMYFRDSSKKHFYNLTSANSNYRTLKQIKARY
ncbi:unnamed protein product [Amaranthus hypochondriacus]